MIILQITREARLRHIMRELLGATFPPGAGDKRAHRRLLLALWVLRELGPDALRRALRSTGSK